MNKFLTFPGKQPVYLGDIEFMQGAVASAFAQLLRNITGQNDASGILSGVDISYTNNAAFWTEGVVTLNGEILPIEAGGPINATNGLYFGISSEGSGSRTFGNGETHNCWETRKAFITNTETLFPLSSVPRISPPSLEGPKVYRFDNFLNTASQYAKLVYNNGVFILMIRQPIISPYPTYWFEGDISELPDTLLQKFTQQYVPSGISTPARFVTTLSSSLKALDISWSVINDKLHLSIPNINTEGSDSFNLEISQILPVF